MPDQRGVGRALGEPRRSARRRAGCRTTSSSTATTRDLGDVQLPAVAEGPRRRRARCRSSPTIGVARPARSRAGRRAPQYVATAVAAYRRWVDALARGGEPPRDADARARATCSTMALAYTRGFGDGFLGGADHQTLVEGRFPKHRGVLARPGRARRAATRSLVERDADGRPWTGALGADAPRAARRHAVGRAAAARRRRRRERRAAPPTLEPRPGMGVVFDARPSRGRATSPAGRSSASRRVAATAGGCGFGSPGPTSRASRAGDACGSPATRAVTRAGRAARSAAGAARARSRVDLVRRAARAGEPLARRRDARGARARRRRAAPPLAAAARRGPRRGARSRDKLGALGGTPFRLGALDLAGSRPACTCRSRS